MNSNTCWKCVVFQAYLYVYISIYPHTPISAFSAFASVISSGQVAVACLSNYHARSYDRNKKEQKRLHW